MFASMKADCGEEAARDAASGSGLSQAKFPCSGNFRCTAFADVREPSGVNLDAKPNLRKAYSNLGAMWFPIPTHVIVMYL